MKQSHLRQMDLFRIVAQHRSDEGPLTGKIPVTMRDFYVTATAAIRVPSGNLRELCQVLSTTEVNVALWFITDLWLQICAEGRVVPPSARILR